MLRRNATLTLVVVTVALGAGCGKKSPSEPEPTPFEVLEVSPDDGTDGVYTDQTLRILFSRPLDPASVDASSIRITHDGTPAEGRLLSSGSAVLFVPLGLAPDADYTITISDAVAAEDGTPLEAPVTSTFRTAATLSNGATEPYADITPPFAQDRFIYLSRRVEYVLAGGDIQGTSQNVLVIDPLPYNTMENLPTDDLLYAVTDSALADGNTRLTAVGNLDSDPADEVVLLGYGPTGPASIRFMNVVDGDLGLWDMPLTLAIDGNQIDPYEYDLAVGDLDGDGLDEVVVLGVVPFMGKSRLWTFDDADHGHLSLGAVDVEGNQQLSGCEGVGSARLAVGNVDDDPEAEILVVLTSESDPEGLQLHIIDDPQVGTTSCAYDYLTVRPDTSFGIDYGVTVANLDGQGRGEIVVAKRIVAEAGPGCAIDNEVELLHRTPGGVQSMHHFYAFSMTEDFEVCNSAQRPRIALRPFELDRDGRQELLIEDQIWQWPAGLDAPQALPFRFPLLRVGQTQVQAVTTGDINGDGVDDVLLALSNGTLEALSIMKVHVGYDLDLKPIYENMLGTLHTRPAPTLNSYTGLALAAANLDDDSVVATPKRVSPADPSDRSVVQRRVLSDDRPIAVVAAPPCYDASVQSAAECRTTVGVDTDRQPDLAVNFSVSAGLSIQLPEVMADANGTDEAAVSFAEQVRMALGSQGATALEQRMDVLVEGAADSRDDLVVFYTVPRHRYVYELVAHPNPSALGAEIYVDLPLPPRILVATRSAYNASQADEAMLDAGILSHTPGDPISYPSLSRLPQILGGTESYGFTSPGAEVPAGTGECAYGMTLLSTDATTFGQVSLPSAVAGEVCDLTTCVGYVFGPGTPSYGAAYMSEGTAFHTTLGAIDAAQWDDRQYAAGCFAYLGELDGQAFVILSHYVD